MDLQTLLVLFAAVLAGLYLAWHALRPLIRSKAGSCGGCGSGCGSEKSNLIAADELLDRARRGVGADARRSDERARQGKQGDFSA